MRAYSVIALNAFMELVRQPVYLLLLTLSGLFIVFLSSVSYFGLGDDVKLVKDMTLAVTLISGLVGAVLCASSSVAQEIRSGTVLTVLAKPVDRATFILGKFTGLAGVLTLLTGHNLVAALLASRIAFDAYGEADHTAVAAYFGATLAAYVLGGFLNYFLRRPFVSDAVWSVVGLTALTVVGLVQFTVHERMFDGAQQADWRLVPASLLILFALWVLAALALACSTRLDVIPTLAICSAFFMLGLVSDYFFGRPAAEGVLWAKVLYAITPNWSQFWVADALEGTKTAAAIWRFVPQAAIYVVTSLSAWLSVALLFFEERELN